MKQTTSVEEDIFCQALEIKDIAQREKYLLQACKSDARLRQTINNLLADHEEASRLFQKIVADFKLDIGRAADDADLFQRDSGIGTAVGPYKIARRLGEGGSGVVYEALQESPVRRKVALKIVKPGPDKWRIFSRFEAERQALELMEHPNIARVLDAGVTADGWPYVVMELVQGIKITEYCAQNTVPLAARLRLLQQVCSAVQHAHQKGIIHCDLKPSNILVIQVEGTPVLKVIDFGIARATVPSMDGSAQNRPVGTPAYMSPEQINGSKDIDTRTDVYSLGVIMYELLAGRPPFYNEEPSKTISATGPLEGFQQFHKPPPPSLAVRSGSHVSLSWNDDLDWIVMTAIHGDRERRYATMRGLSEDIARYLANEPILARAPGRLYRFRKLVRRNRLATSAIAAGILALVAGFSASSLLYLKASAAERTQVQLRANAEAAERKQAQLRAEAEEREYITKAAILLSQFQPAAADVEIQHMGGILTQPSVEATSVFRVLGAWNALQGNWKVSAQRLLALSRVNRFDDTDQTDNATRDLLPIAPVLVEAGDADALRQFENMLTERLGHSNNPIAAEQILKICLLVPPPDDLLPKLQSLGAVAEKSLSGKSVEQLNWSESWRCFSLGLWSYRTGRYDQATHWLTMAINAPDNDLATVACSLTTRSLAYERLGQTADAQADLTNAQDLIDAKFSFPLELNRQGYWFDWLSARILLRQATHK